MESEYTVRVENTGAYNEPLKVYKVRICSTHIIAPEDTDWRTIGFVIAETTREGGVTHIFWDKQSKELLMPEDEGAIRDKIFQQLPSHKIVREYGISSEEMLPPYKHG